MGKLFILDLKISWIYNLKIAFNNKLLVVVEVEMYVLYCILLFNLHYFLEITSVYYVLLTHILSPKSNWQLLNLLQVFDAENINQSLQMIFNILVNSNSGMTLVYAVDLFQDLLKHHKFQESLQR